MEEIHEDIHELPLVADCFRMLPRFIVEENQDDKYKPPPFAEEPWLIATHDNQKCNKLEKQIFRTNVNSYIKTIPELDRNIILAAHQGWLVLRDRENCTIYSLWNPVTSQFLQLPELPIQDDIKPSVCLLTSSLDLFNNPETCVLVLFFNCGIMFSCTPTTSHEFSWVKQCIELDGTILRINTAAVVEGIIYALAFAVSPNANGNRVEKLVCVKNANNGSSCSFTIEQPVNIKRPNTNLGLGFMLSKVFYYMVESDRDLYYIYITAVSDDNNANNNIILDIIKVWIWRFDFTNMDWIEVKSLRNRAFLLGTSCTWCWATPSRPGEAFIEENCIYLAMTDDDKVYSYNLDDDSCTILLPHPSFLASYYGPTWFTTRDHQGLLRKREVYELIKEEQEEQIQNIINLEFQERVEDTDTQEPPSGTLLSELPLDILQAITKRMNLFDYMNFRLTCKRFHEVNPISQWRDYCSYPLFLFPKDSNGTYELLDPFENISRPITIPHISSNVLSSIEHYKDGWLLVRFEGRSLRYMYPFTFTPESWKYPPHILGSPRFGFSTCPISSDCLTVGLCGLSTPCFDYSESPNEKWKFYDTEFNPEEDISFQPNYKTGPKYHNNAFYFLGKEGCLGEFRSIQGEISWNVYKYPFTEDGDTLFDSCYLVELDGELVSVFIKATGRCLEMFKFDISNKCWIELDTLGDHILFLSTTSSYSLKAEKSEMANRIYLPRRKGNEIVFYSLDTRKYHTSGSADYGHDDLSGTKSQKSCCWIW